MEQISSASSVDAVPAGEPAGPREGRAKRRRFTAEYKRRMVAEYDSAPKGTKGALLRRERLYDSHIQEWRAAIGAGTLEQPPRRPGPPKGSGRSPEQARPLTRRGRSRNWSRPA